MSPNWRSEVLQRYGYTLDKPAQRVSKIYQIERQDLSSKSRQKDGVEGRSVQKEIYSNDRIVTELQRDHDSSENGSNCTNQCCVRA